MKILMNRGGLKTAIAAAALAFASTACSNHGASAPGLPPVTGTAGGVQSTQKTALASSKYISVSPDYLYFGNPSSETLTVLATNAGALSASSDNQAIATVSPASQPSKPASGKQAPKFTATFTVKPISVGVSNITIKDASGNTAVSVAVVLDRAFVGSWVVKKPMPTGRYFLGAAAINDTLYAVGGFQLDPYVSNDIPQTALEAYDPQTDLWTQKAPMPTARGSLAVAAVNGILYAVGGSDGAQGLTSVEAYNPGTNSWSSKAPLPSPRWEAGAAAVNGILYVIGGGAAEALAYDPEKNRWRTRAPMPEPVGWPSVAVVNDDIYVFGGMTSGMTTWTVQVYHTATDTWTSIPDGFPYGNYYHAAGTIGGICYVVGGGASYLSGDAAYYPSNNTRAEIAGMTVAQTGLAAVVINNRLYTVGGWTGGETSRTPPYTTLQVYTP